MEEDDELFPNKDGHLDLKYRGWTEIDDTVWSLSETLITLDLSFNGISTIPESLGKLTQLKEFICSCNKIITLPSTLGCLQELRILKANGNQLAKIPEEIGKCKYLTHLFLNENNLVGIPPTIAECFRLKVLKLQTNNLRQLPITLAKLEKIETIDLSNNRDLNMVPIEMRENTKSIMWILSVHFEHSQEMEFISAATRDLGKFAKSVEEKTVDLRENISSLKKQKSCLLLERSSMEIYLALETVASNCNKKIRYVVKECKNLFSRTPPAVVTETAESS